MPTIKIVSGDARSTGLADRSVHCIATSPPYWGLRSYLNKDDPKKALEIGSELTPGAYVESMRAVGRECHRVLRDDGTMWLNLGDTYASGEIGRHDQATHWPGMDEARNGQREQSGKRSGLPSGNLVGIPWRVAFALQSDGWILRSAIPWVKANCMPESVTNRPTVAHEYVFLFAKAKGYFFDADAVRMLSSPNTTARSESSAQRAGSASGRGGSCTGNGNVGGNLGLNRPELGRNLRTSDFMNAALDEYAMYIERVREDGGLLLSPEGDPLAFIVNPTPYTGAHFAAWPPRLVAPMIKAGTSERGCCPVCGGPWVRTVEKTAMVVRASARRATNQEQNGTRCACSGTMTRPPTAKTIGWSRQCECPYHDPIHCTVLDPFGGSGTTAQVAEALGRDAVLCELNEAYHPLIRERLAVKLNPRDLKPREAHRPVAKEQLTLLG